VKKLIVITGPDKGVRGYKTTVGERHTLIRTTTGELMIVANHHLLDETPEISESLEGLSDAQVFQICRSIAK